MTSLVGGKGGTLQRVLEDVLRVMKLFVWAKRVMAGSEAQVLDDESYTANLVTLTSLRWTF